MNENYTKQLINQLGDCSYIKVNIGNTSVLAPIPQQHNTHCHAAKAFVINLNALPDDCVIDMHNFDLLGDSDKKQDGATVLEEKPFTKADVQKIAVLVIE